jgi:transcriptional regulator with XRE-family HTH domain
MPKRRKKPLPPLELGEGTIGQRLSRLRKERGLSQIELAEKIGITNNLISDYETGRLMMNGEMVARFAIALKVSADSILGLTGNGHDNIKPSLKILRRMTRIDSLTLSEQKAILKTVDMFLQAAGK